MSLSPWKHGHRSIGSPRIYGMQTWGDYFTARQSLALTRLARLSRVFTDKSGDREHAIGRLLAVALSKLAELACANCRWEPVAECPRSIRTHRKATTLDRVHAAMILQSSGRAHALRALLKAEQERGLDFIRLANALSALYPKDCEEKRLLDAMLLAVPR